MSGTRCPPPAESADRERRRFLLGGVTAAIGGALLGLGGCREEVDESLRLPLSSMPEGEPIEAILVDEPVYLLREGDRVRALSRWCSHMGCRVGWNPDEQIFECPCHAGRFHRSGEALSGPPTSPLRSFTVRVEGNAAVVEAPGSENR